ncbi:MAG: outer membrane beta-barrel protein [Pseudomonadota bacterium]
MKRILFTLIFLTASLPASAQWVVGGGYLNLSDDDDGIDVSLGAVYGSLGYIIEGEGQFSFIPEVRVGFGVSDDTNSGVDVELDTFFALSLRGQYDFESGLYLYAAPSYARAEFTATSPLFSGSVSEDDWEFGIGGGAGYRFTDQTWGEVSYETFDGTDAFSIGVKFAF